MNTLAEALPTEQERVREVLSAYKGLTGTGFTIAMIEASLRKADEAASGGDLVAMIAAYEDLKGIK